MMEKIRLEIAFSFAEFTCMEGFTYYAHSDCWTKKDVHGSYQFTTEEIFDAFKKTEWYYKLITHDNTKRNNRV